MSQTKEFTIINDLEEIEFISEINEPDTDHLTSLGLLEQTIEQTCQGQSDSHCEESPSDESHLEESLSNISAPAGKSFFTRNTSIVPILIAAIPTLIIEASNFLSPDLHRIFAFIGLHEVGASIALAVVGNSLLQYGYNRYIKNDDKNMLELTENKHQNDLLQSRNQSQEIQNER